MQRKGKTFIVSGPSGVGKSTVLKAPFDQRTDLYFPFPPPPVTPVLGRWTVSTTTSSRRRSSTGWWRRTSFWSMPST